MDAEEMKSIRGKIQGDTELTEDVELYGMIVGSTTVSANTVLKLHGMIVGNLLLKRGSSVDLHGMVNGNVI